MNILVADDDPISRRVLSASLAGPSIRVLLAVDGEDALRVTAEYQPPVILLDWLMPGLDGLDVCRIIRQRQSLQRPHILMITSRGATDDVVSAFAAGADDYVTKPYDLDQLRARVWAGVRLALREEALVHERGMLRDALGRMNRMPEVVPICASCKRVRDGEAWLPVEQYVTEHTGVHFSHGLCPNCVGAFA